MHTDTIRDYLIIGQGLAGTILSYHCLQQGHSVWVINTTDHSAASYVAAGLLSPITGPRLAKTWEFDDAYAYACTTYQNLEQDLQQQFYFPLPYLRALDTPSINNYAQRRLVDPVYTNYIQPGLIENTTQRMAAVSIAHAAYIDTKTLLDRYKDWLQTHDTYIEDFFDEHQLQLHDTYIQYKNVRARTLIYCNGLAAQTSRFFPNLAFNPTKGEVITISTPLDLKHIQAAHGIFVVPMGHDRYYVGTTYERTYHDALPNPVNRDRLMQAYTHLFNTSYTILNHQAGIRPTTFGHHPYTIWHSQQPRIGLFTGFGSKGLSLIPFHAQDFLAHQPIHLL